MISASRRETLSAHVEANATRTQPREQAAAQRPVCSLLGGRGYPIQKKTTVMRRSAGGPPQYALAL